MIGPGRRRRTGGPALTTRIGCYVTRSALGNS